MLATTSIFLMPLFPDFFLKYLPFEIEYWALSSYLLKAGLSSEEDTRAADCLVGVGSSSLRGMSY